MQIYVGSVSKCFAYNKSYQVAYLAYQIDGMGVSILRLVPAATIFYFHENLYWQSVKMLLLYSS